MASDMSLAAAMSWEVLATAGRQSTLEGPTRIPAVGLAPWPRVDLTFACLQNVSVHGKGMSLQII